MSWQREADEDEYGDEAGMKACIWGRKEEKARRSEAKRDSSVLNVLHPAAVDVKGTLSKTLQQFPIHTLCDTQLI